MRLRKLAEIEELNEMNMPVDVINQVLYNQGEDVTVEEVLYRRMMNENTKYIVEIWSLSDNQFGVFSGKFDGMWTINNINYNGKFASSAEAESYVQNNLQSQAEYGETVKIESRLRKNNFKILYAAGKEPDYKSIAQEFYETLDINIPEVEKGHKTSLNKYYDDWVAYMKKYYPEWAKYPAFIWRGWGYLVDYATQKHEEQNEDNKDKEEIKEDTIKSEEVEKQTIDESNQDVSTEQQPVETPSVNMNVDNVGGDTTSN